MSISPIESDQEGVHCSQHGVPRATQGGLATGVGRADGQRFVTVVLQVHDVHDAGGTAERLSVFAASPAVVSFLFH